MPFKVCLHSAQCLREETLDKAEISLFYLERKDLTSLLHPKEYLFRCPVVEVAVTAGPVTGLPACNASSRRGHHDSLDYNLELPCRTRLEDSPQGTYLAGSHVNRLGII